MNRRNALKKTGLIAGGSLLVPSLLTLLQSCRSEPRIDWQPLFFKEEEAKFMSVFLDTILPRTTTPGALDVKADLFMDKVFAKLYNDEGRAQVRADITKFNEDCKKEYGAIFADLSEGDRVKVLKEQEAKSPKFNSGVWGKSVGEQKPVGFYRSMKSMALWAYLSSEEIGKNVLNYDPIPQEYLGCIPLADVGNSWSL